jgi:hypothetical protein
VQIESDDRDRPERPWLSIEFGRARVNVEAADGVRIRDGLRLTGGKVEERLAMIVDAKATELLAAPLYAGTVRVRMDAQEKDCLLTLLTGWAEDDSIDDAPSKNLRALLAALQI